MKFSVLLLAVITAQCMASKSWNADSYLDDISYISGWASYLKRISIISMTLSGVVLYYIPESRTYARRGCHVLIDLVANGLKSILSGTDGDSTNLYEEYEQLRKRRRTNPDVRLEDESPESKSMVLVEKEYANDEYQYVMITNKIVALESEGAVKTLRDLKRHRDHPKHVRDDNHRCHRHRRYRNSAKASPKEPYVVVRSSLSPSLLRFYPEQSTDILKYSNAEFYCPLAEESDPSTLEPSDKYASFVISSQESALNDGKCGKENVIVTDDARRRSRDKRGSSNDVTMYSKNDEPTRDYDRYIVTNTGEQRRCKKGFGTKNVSLLEREPASDTSQQLQDDDSNLDNSMALADDNVEDDRTVIYGKRVPRREQDSADKDEDSDVKITRERQVRTTDHRHSLSEEVPIRRSNQTTLKIREIDSKKKESRNHRKQREISNDKSDRSNSAEVLSQLGDQILKLDQTIRTMRPSSRRRRRCAYNEDDYALRTVESILKDIKRGFREYDDRIKSRRRSKISRSTSGKEREGRLVNRENRIDDDSQKGEESTGKRDPDAESEDENRDVDLSEIRSEADLDPEDLDDVPLVTSTSVIRHNGGRDRETSRKRASKHRCDKPQAESHGVKIDTKGRHVDLI